MRKLVVSESLTVDGVFDAETMGQWVYPYASDERDECIKKIVEASDTLLYGRTTHEIHSTMRQQSDRCERKMTLWG